MASLCYHPTTTLFVDDDSLFLDALKQRFEGERPSLFYTAPKKALQFLNQEYDYENFVRRCVKSDEEADFDRISFNVNLRKVREEAERADRFSEIAVIVVDYSMPQLNGLEFCKQISNPNILKVLLTGEGDANLAVEAFNKGLIDKFILKSTQDLHQALGAIIKELERQYFAKLTALIKDKVNLQTSKLNYLNDVAFNDFFKQILDDEKIIEYYLLDEAGGLLLVDDQGEASLLIVMSEKDLEDDFHHAEIEGAPEEVLLPLKAKQKLLYIPNEEDLQTPPSQWSKYLHPANKINGDRIYFYALLHDAISKNSIASFQKYLAR